MHESFDEDELLIIVTLLNIRVNYVKLSFAVAPGSYSAREEGEAAVED